MYKILVVGESCLDVFTYGDVERLSPEAPVPVFKPKTLELQASLRGRSYLVNLLVI